METRMSAEELHAQAAKSLQAKRTYGDYQFELGSTISRAARKSDESAQIVERLPDDLRTKLNRSLELSDDEAYMVVGALTVFGLMSANFDTSDKVARLIARLYLIQNEVHDNLTEDEKDTIAQVGEQIAEEEAQAAFDAIFGNVEDGDKPFEGGAKIDGPEVPDPSNN